MKLLGLQSEIHIELKLKRVHNIDSEHAVQNSCKLSIYKQLIIPYVLRDNSCFIISASYVIILDCRVSATRTKIQFVSNFVRR